MTIQDLLDKIRQLPERPVDMPTTPPRELVAFVVALEPRPTAMEDDDAGRLRARLGLDRGAHRTRRARE